MKCGGDRKISLQIIGLPSDRTTPRDGLFTLSPKDSLLSQRMSPALRLPTQCIHLYTSSCLACLVHEAAVCLNERCISYR